MTPFTEKLTFLMRIAEVSNKELASALGVDPSMISLLRTGKRKLSRKTAQAQKMAVFFAEHCSAPYQRQALSEMLGQVSISPGLPAEVLAARLESWLLGESKNLADSILTGIESHASPVRMAEVPAYPITADEEHTMFFFGTEGRREVMLRLLQACRAMKTPGVLQTVVDDNLEWMLSDYTMAKKAQSGLLELMDRGFTIQQIIPPMNYINRYTESLQFWLPLYATGKVDVYYYPRLRGNLYRHSNIVVPGCCVEYAASVGLNGKNDITMFSTEPRLVEAFGEQFREHANLCRPAMFSHPEYQDALHCFREYFSCQGRTVQLLNTLSVQTMPEALLYRLIQESEGSIPKDTFRIYLEEMPVFLESLTRDPFLDMCYLASPEEVLSGKVPVVFSDKLHYGQPYYTAETYCLHLQNILHMMEQYDNYFFLPLSRREHPDFDMMVKEETRVLITRTSDPLLTLDIRRQPLVVAFQEHLLQRAGTFGYKSISKEHIRMELRGLIQQLNSAAQQQTGSEDPEVQE